MVTAAFRLDRQNILAALPVDTDIDFVDFNLTDPFDRGTQMVLKRKTQDAEKDIDQSIIANFSK